MNADSRVMEFMPSLLSRDESDTLIDHIVSHFRERGFGLCVAELRQDHSFVGFIGLAVPRFQAIFTPCVEIGRRLSAEYWGQGLATEGAREIVRCAFGNLGLKDLVSFTVPGNWRSRRVMEKLGMSHNPADDFDHPNLPEGTLCNAMSCIACGAHKSNQLRSNRSLQRSGTRISGRMIGKSSLLFVRRYEAPGVLT